MIRYILFLALCLLLTTSCYTPYFITNETIRGNGEIISEHREMPYFSSIRISGARTTILYGNNDGPVKLTGDSNILDYTESYVQNEKLIITTKKNINLNPTKRVVVEIPGSYVNNVRVSGSNKITLLHIDQKSFQIRGSGSTSVVAEGFTDFLDIRMSGSSEIEAGNLIAAEATIRTSGSSHAFIHALDAITSRSSGSSQIRYLGQPKDIVNQSTGSSSLQNVQ